MAMENEFETLKKNGVLTAVVSSKLPREVIRTQHPPTPQCVSEVRMSVLSCCDGHHMPDMMRYVGMLCEQIKETESLPSDTTICTHWKTENGGPFVLSVPQLQRRYYRGRAHAVDENILGSIKEGMDLKGSLAVLLIAHAICGKADPIFKTLTEYCVALSGAKDRVMEEFNLPRYRVITHLQIFRARGGRSTHHLDCSALEELLARSKHSASEGSLGTLAS